MSDEREAGLNEAEATGESTTEERAAEPQEAEGGGEDQSELLKAAQEENERLRRQLAQREDGRPATQPTTAGGGYEAQLQAEVEAIARESAALNEKEVREGRNMDTITARQELLARSQRAHGAITALSLRKSETETFIAALPREQQAPFRTFAKENGHRFADLEAMYDSFEARLLRAAKPKVKAAEKIIEQRDRGVVGSGTREVTAAEAKQKVAKMSARDFDKKYNDLIQEGRMDEAIALSRQAGTSDLVEDD